MLLKLFRLTASLTDYGFYQHGSYILFIVFGFYFYQLWKDYSQKHLLRSGNSALKCDSLLINRHRQGNGSN